MAVYSIFDGGTRNNSANFSMYPSVNTAGVPPQGYADHQRARLYSVTKVIDLRPLVNTGVGGGKDVALLGYLQDNAITFAANDDLDSILLLPKTVYQGMSYEVIQPLAGVTFTIYRQSVGTGTPYFAGVSGATAGYNYTTTAVGAPLITTQDMVRVRFTAVPANFGANSQFAMKVNLFTLALDNGNA